MDDLISRKATINALYELYHNRPLDYGRIRMRGDVLNTIENVPSSERQGRWVNGKCSKCGCEPLRMVFYRGELIYSQSDIFNYCPNCGVKMK